MTAERVLRDTSRVGDRGVFFGDVAADLPARRSSAHVHGQPAAAATSTSAIHSSSIGPSG